MMKLTSIWVGIEMQYNRVLKRKSKLQARIQAVRLTIAVGKEAQLALRPKVILRERRGAT